MNENRIEMLSRSIKENPNDPFYPYALALEYKEQSTQKCFQLLKKVYEKFPDYLPLYFQYAEVLIDLDEAKLAEEIYQKGIKLATENKDLKTLAELKNAYQNFLFE
jgi:tetratricopeptide (TPR) repeat protein